MSVWWATAATARLPWQKACCFMTGAINRMGNSADGNTVCDYDPEEIRRQISISTAVAPLEYKGCKINLLDTPGAFDFSGEVMEALRAADAAILVCSAKDGITVGFEKAWKYCEERDMPRFHLYLQDRRGKQRLQRHLQRPAGAVRQQNRPPGGPHAGTPTKRPPASSTCSTSGPMRCRTLSGWRWTFPRKRLTWWRNSTKP